MACRTTGEGVENLGWQFYDSSGRKLSTASTLIDNLDIDGATDIGAAIVDADLFIVDDGAGGTNRKTAASRLTTYINANSSGVAKVWVLWELTGAHGITASYNMTSVSDGGAVGNTDHLWATDFSSANYVISGQAEDDHTVWHSATTLAAGGVTTQIRSANDAVVRDSTEAMLVAFGDQ
jgi:hypothetical protein